MNLSLSKPGSSQATKAWSRAIKLVLVSMMLLLIGIAGVQPALALKSDSQSEEIRVVGRLPLKLSPAEQNEFLQRTLDLAKVTRQEDAVTSYSCNADIEVPGVYVFDEIWPSEKALNDHLATNHFNEWWQWVVPHLDGELMIKVAPTSEFHILS